MLETFLTHIYNKTDSLDRNSVERITWNLESCLKSLFCHIMAIVTSGGNQITRRKTTHMPKSQEAFSHTHKMWTLYTMWCLAPARFPIQLGDSHKVASDFGLFTSKLDSILYLLLLFPHQYQSTTGYNFLLWYDKSNDEWKLNRKVSKRPGMHGGSWL